MRRSTTGYAFGAAALAALVLVALAGPAFSQSKKKYKKQISEYAKQLDKLAKQDEWGVSEEDRKRARQWIADAKELLAQGNVETAGWLVTQVGEAIDLIQALVQAKRLEDLADEQRKTYEEKKDEEIPKLKEEIEDLREQKKKLKAEIEKLR